ncbi:DUF808 domain-containing protein [Corynebacterium sp. HMSC04H06]|uniref:DUF808 domain-containing protein n=1 Tax=Corynebacterium sp. HMSC04H06 TaxID=1581050 RepID=UPI0008A4F1D8|nr:DUF808 domain-containing protein [Corynebacterium sp. HMSC04H06]OFS19904.1 ABC transporter [Corynebacterium sp. HMSC04H06]
MAGGLLALFDDIALIARSAASSVDDVAALTGKTSSKAVGVVVDDAAVTPQYVAGVDPKRELPMIWRITKGSLINKLIIILPVALLLSWLAPWALTPILMLGGAYLCFEGAHKIAAKLLPGLEDQETPVRESGPDAEDSLVSSAIRTDLILSAEIMVIALNELMSESFGLRVITLITIAIAFTLGVYGAVAVLVKMDDIGLRLLERRDGNSLVGKALVKGMPYVLHIIGIIGTAAMLWVGGHILTSGLAEFGQSAPADAVHHLSQLVPAGVLEWLVDTAGSMVFGFIVGAIIVAVVEGVQHVRAAK